MNVRVIASMQELVDFLLGGILVSKPNFGFHRIWCLLFVVCERRGDVSFFPLLLSRNPLQHIYFVSSVVEFEVIIIFA
jgi:hypothetical protein